MCCDLREITKLLDYKKSGPIKNFYTNGRIMLVQLLLFCACSRIAVLTVAEQYTNEWAVKLQGIAPEQVDALAEKHGFVNYGKVKNKNYKMLRQTLMIIMSLCMCINFRCRLVT